MKINIRTMENLEKYKDLEFHVEGYPTTIEIALKLWKRQYTTFSEFHKNVILPSNSQDFEDFSKEVELVWNDIEDISVTEAFSQKNIEIRRLYFKAIGTTELFKDLKPELIHTDSISKPGKTYTEDGKEVDTMIKDDYELYKIDGARLFPEEKQEWRATRATIYAVRCWCSTTKREYWIYVPRTIGEKNNALNAIAWTVRLEYSNIKSLYRQGDVFISELTEESEGVPPYHLSSEQYVTLLKAVS